MKNESAKTTRIAARNFRLADTTWLVIGIFLTLQGGRQLLETWRSDNLLFSYLIGALQVACGAAALYSADKVLRRWREPSASGFRKRTAAVLISLVGTSFLLFTVHSLAVLSGQAETDGLYRQNIFRLLTFALYFSLVNVAVKLRLRNNLVE